MVAHQYIPDRGDVVWLDFTPQAGHEQSGRRPALVISPKAYNQKVGLALTCPITSRKKGYPFEEMVRTPEIHGVVLSDKLQSLDWSIRKVDFIARIDSATLNRIREKIIQLIMG